MELVELGSMELRYVEMEIINYEAGGQGFGRMEGRLEGGRLAGDIKLFNIPPKRPDNVFMPTLRGILTTAEEAKLYMEMNGISLAREDRRHFVTSLTFRTADARYDWANHVFGIVEGILTPDGLARCRSYICEPTIKHQPSG